MIAPLRAYLPDDEHGRNPLQGNANQCDDEIGDVIQQEVHASSPFILALLDWNP
jgi:hypothetical protein